MLISRKLLFFCLMLSFMAPEMFAAASLKAPVQETRGHSLLQKKMDRSERKLKKLQHKLSKKLDKASQKKEDGKGIWATLSFILGLVLVAAGIALLIAVIANPIGGFFYFLAGLMIAGGAVLLLFATSPL
jgi:hypothetical protein